MSDGQPINDGGPAFPMYVPAHSGFGPDEHHGLSLRDYFAAKAMAGIISNPSEVAGLDTQATLGRESIAETAYEYADAMIAARKGGAA